MKEIWSVMILEKCGGQSVWIDVALFATEELARKFADRYVKPYDRFKIVKTYVIEN